MKRQFSIISCPSQIFSRSSAWHLRWHSAEVLAFPLLAPSFAFADDLISRRCRAGTSLSFLLCSSHLIKLEGENESDEQLLRRDLFSLSSSLFKGENCSFIQPHAHHLVPSGDVISSSSSVILSKPCSQVWKKSWQTRLTLVIARCCNGIQSPFSTLFHIEWTSIVKLYLHGRNCHRRNSIRGIRDAMSQLVNIHFHPQTEFASPE